MSVRGSSRLLWCTIFGLLAVGCGDPVRTTSQPIRLRVSESVSGKPVAYADVSLKVDFDAAYPISEETRSPPELWHREARAVWKQQPWTKSSTNNEGLAEMEYESTVLDWTTGSEPPPERDKVTGLPYLIRVQKDKISAQELSVLMKPGQSANGKSFTVTVIDVQAPRYIETKF